MRSFERHVFPKVSDALIFGRLITAADIQHNAAVHNFGSGDVIMNNPYAVLKCIYLVFSHK
jgi:hypothetical protein